MEKASFENFLRHKECGGFSFCVLSALLHPLRTLKIPALRKFEESRVMCEFDKKTVEL